MRMLSIFLVGSSVVSVHTERYPFPSMMAASRTGRGGGMVPIHGKSPTSHGNEVAKSVSQKDTRTRLERLHAATSNAITQAIAFSILVLLAFHVYLYLVQNAFWIIWVGIPCGFIDWFIRDRRQRKLKRSIDETKGMLDKEE